MIHRYEKCWILSLPAIGKWRIEFVYAPRGYRIREHTHDREDIKLIPLFCHNIKFYRRKYGDSKSRSHWATFRDIGRVFTIDAGDAHYFEVSNWPLIFMNIEHWFCKPQSAAIDLTLTNNLCPKDLDADKQLVEEVEL